MFQTKITLPVDFDDSSIKDAIGSLINIPISAVDNFKIIKLSLDCRKKLIHYEATVCFSLKPSCNPSHIARLVKKSVITPYDEPKKYCYNKATVVPAKSPVVVGSGPAGLFSALILAKAGLNPIVIEQGGTVDDRIQAVQAFNHSITTAAKTSLDTSTRAEDNNDTRADKSLFSESSVDNALVSECRADFQATRADFQADRSVRLDAVSRVDKSLDSECRADFQTDSAVRLDTDCNIQFGEGGAGTFSDGKLNTLTKDPRNRFVKEVFVRFGADQNILYLNKPHIGTDKLQKIIPNLRNYIISLGGKFLFRHKVVDFVLEDSNSTDSAIFNPSDSVESGINAKPSSIASNPEVENFTNRDNSTSSADTINNTNPTGNADVNNVDNNGNADINSANPTDNTDINTVSPTGTTDNCNNSDINGSDTNSCLNKKIIAVVVEHNGKTFTINTSDVILATGHSSRQIFSKMHQLGANMQKKAFSMGVRIEHPREYINAIQYGSANILTKNGTIKTADYKTLYNELKCDNRQKQPFDISILPTADYKLSCHLNNGRSVYTFCMCPGGEVVNASSEEGRLCTNGMSNFSRLAKNSNSAVLVNVVPEDFEGDVLQGVEFQRKYESLAYTLTDNYKIPCETVGNFLNNTDTNKLGEVTPSVKYQFARLKECMPQFVYDSLKQGIVELDSKMKGFNKADAVLLGVETRTSSPVRILRNENFESNINGLYPTGEGAGYSGGIMSSAVDGIKVAEAIIEKYSK